MGPTVYGRVHGHAWEGDVRKIKICVHTGRISLEMKLETSHSMIVGRRKGGEAHPSNPNQVDGNGWTNTANMILTVTVFGSN